MDSPKASPKERIITARARRHPGVPATPPPPKENQNTDLMLAATAIFDGGSNECKLASGRIVTIRPATMGHIGKIMAFFGSLISNIDPTKFSDLVETLVQAQKMAIARGDDPNNIGLRELASDELVSKAFDHVSVLSTIMAASFDTLPSLVPLFTDLSEEEFSALTFDEGAMIAGGIFLLNYGFFTQSLRPMLMVFMKSWASRKHPQTAKKIGSA